MRGIDRNFVQASAFDGQGTVPDTLFVKDSPFYSDAPVAPSYDQQRAQQLFDELAAEGKPVSFAITTFQTTQSMRASQAMQTQLSRFSNVNVQVKVFDTPTAAAAVSRFDFQAVNRGTTFTDPDPVLYDALHTGSPSNINGISDPDIDKALDTGRAAPSTEQREQAYAIVAQRFAALYPTLYYLRLEYSVVYGDHLHGATLYGTGSLRVDGLWATK
ncbi:peptide/nickel transport system substrate-binding protein [Pseudonocardia oroxyli]|uniref:Peptide/nickel transport system substrate-binding protein n=2 Tax=Pseudonocardia oroxyli TaxID=366584 RepID=A0A1G8EQG8_PSEOR|nr:peptide/nickel transport system substrate-binding protein [Pseudonocardia oroxyli]